MQTLIYVVLALIAFAANSVLCRMALGGSSIDPTSFTLIRLVSGSLMLWVIVRKKSPIVSNHSSWLAAIMLFTYAAAFSFAYVLLDTGIGALVLFGCVQITMVVASIYSGSRLSAKKLLGLVAAMAGLAYMLAPSTQLESSISIAGFILMALAGVAWGIYTLLGKGSVNPLHDTMNNFLKTTPLSAMLAALYFLNTPLLSSEGIVLAIVSGAITSGLGYAIWYSVLPRLSVLQSGVVQLFVPVLAALGGVVFNHEALTLRFVISLVVVLGGIYLVLQGVSERPQPE